MAIKISFFLTPVTTTKVDLFNPLPIENNLLYSLPKIQVRRMWKYKNSEQKVITKGVGCLTQSDRGTVVCVMMM